MASSRWSATSLNLEKTAFPDGLIYFRMNILQEIFKSPPIHFNPKLNPFTCPHEKWKRKVPVATGPLGPRFLFFASKRERGRLAKNLAMACALKFDLQNVIILRKLVNIAQHVESLDFPALFVKRNCCVALLF